MKTPVMPMKPNKTKAKVHKNLRLMKVQARLKRRIMDFDELCKSRPDHGKGFRCPGSMKVR